MTPSLKPNLGTTHLMFVSPVHHQKQTARRVSALSPILKHLNTSTLAFAMFVAPLALCFGGSTVAQAACNDPFSSGPVRPGSLDYRTELPQGYLKVYSATDRFKDGDARYFPHSSYAIYTTDGRLFENVKNKRFAGDEVPEVVALPVGTYAVVARSERGGYVGMLVVIKEGQQAILDLDLWETKTQRSLAQN
jgi:hypothetical protein